MRLVGIQATAIVRHDLFLPSEKKPQMLLKPGALVLIVKEESRAEESLKRRARRGEERSMLELGSLYRERQGVG